MSEGVSGPEPGDAAQAEDPDLAERLIRDEFSEATSAHRVRVTNPTAEVPVVSAGLPAADVAVGAVAAPAIHDEFAAPRRAARTRSHRTGMLAGLGVVGVLLAVLVIVGPGGSKPHLPAQSVQDVSPISASGPRTEEATTPSTAPTSTPPPSTPASTPTTVPSHQNQTVSTYITYVYLPGTTTPTATQPTTAAATATTTPPPAATTTTVPPTTTTTARHCILGLIC